MNQNEQKPLIIKIDEAKANIIQSVNNALAQLPCYLVEPMLLEILAQVKEGTRQEMEAAKVQMREASVATKGE